MKQPYLKLDVRRLKAERFQKIALPVCLLQNGVYLAGGALRTLVDQDEEIADFDLFFMNQEVLDATLKLLDENTKRTFTCPEGKLFSFEWEGYKIQCIVNDFFSSAQSVIHNFDFHACSVVLDWTRKELIISRDFVKNVKLKELSLQRLTFPAATFKIIVKYKDKGYRINKIISEFILTLNPTITNDEMKFYID